ncbi:MAG: hypothetical protein ABW167_07655 [Baekduia sp.]
MERSRCPCGKCRGDGLFGTLRPAHDPSYFCFAFPWHVMAPVADLWDPVVTDPEELPWRGYSPPE